MRLPCKGVPSEAELVEFASDIKKILNKSEVIPIRFDYSMKINDSLCIVIPAKVGIHRIRAR